MRSPQVVRFSQLFLHLEEERCVPGIQPRDGVVLLHSLGEGLHVLVLDLLGQRLDQFGLSGVSECWVLILVLGESVGRIQTVYTEMAEQGLEEIVLGGVLQQVGLDAVCRDLKREKGGISVSVRVGRTGLTCSYIWMAFSYFSMVAVY